MSVAALDELLNAAVGAVFNEPVVFSQGGPSEAIYLDPAAAIELGLVPVEHPVPVLSIPYPELQRLGAREGSFVTVRGVQYTLMDGVDDPVADAGNRAHLKLRRYA